VPGTEIYVDVGVVKTWINVRSPGDRLRKIDLFVGEPGPGGELNISGVRIAVEKQSVITARTATAPTALMISASLIRIHSARPEALLVATVLVGLAQGLEHSRPGTPVFPGSGGRVYGEGVAAPFLGGHLPLDGVFMGDQ